jgi:hypothetical protein
MSGSDLRSWLGLAPKTPKQTSNKPKTPFKQTTKKAKFTDVIQEQDEVITTTTNKEKQPQEQFPPYSSRFLWPMSDYARWPGSGDFSFDSMRRSGYHRLEINLRDLLSFILNKCNVNELKQGLHCQEEDLDLISNLYYKRRLRWTRMDKLDLIEGGEENLSRLKSMGVIQCFEKSETDLNTLKACYSLHTVEELTMILESRGLLKDALVDVACRKHSRIYEKSRKVLSGLIVSLTKEFYYKILRIHQYVFSYSDLEPEDAVDFMNSGRLGTISFVGEGKRRVIKKQMPFHSFCWEKLVNSLDEMENMAHSAILLHANNATSTNSSSSSTSSSKQNLEISVKTSLHIASTNLMETNRCGCWMEKRLEENYLRIVSLGIHLLEKERKYEEAVHYLRVSLSSLERRSSCFKEGVVNLLEEEEEANPDTRITFHRCRLIHRLAQDLGHLDRKNDALLEIEKILFQEPNSVLWDQNSSMKIGSTLNRLGGVGAGLILMCLRLSEPPRRWKAPSHIKLIDIPEKFICLKRIENVGVEAAALEYYLKMEGFEKGQHCENGIIHTLFGLIFAQEEEECFEDDGILNDFCFVKDKAKQKDILLKLLHNLGPDIVKRNWEKYHERQIRGVNWTRNSLEEVLLICKLIGGEALSVICSLLLDAYKAWCGGLTDLLVWNENKLKFVEIKGPGDHLSDRQRAWGEKLISCGVPMEVCYVQWEQPISTFNQIS